MRINVTIMMGVLMSLVSAPVFAQEESDEEIDNTGINRVTIEQVGQESLVLEMPEGEPFTIRHTREGELEENLFIQQEGKGNEIETWQDQYKQKLTVTQKGSGNRIVVKQRN